MSLRRSSEPVNSDRSGAQEAPSPSSDLPVALKVPLDPHRGEEVLMADGKYMLDLPRHPGIVAVNWQGRVGSIWVVEMEFVNGCPLSHLMGDESQWSKVTFEDIIRWFTGIAESLAFLHEHEIAHGDIKPDNLLLDERSGRLKITDFGTSRRLTDNLIRTFRHAGAWAYQAPEIQQANQRGAVSDLFLSGLCSTTWRQGGCRGAAFTNCSRQRRSPVPVS